MFSCWIYIRYFVPGCTVSVAYLAFFMMHPVYDSDYCAAFCLFVPRLLSSQSVIFVRLSYTLSFCRHCFSRLLKIFWKATFLWRCMDARALQQLLMLLRFILRYCSRDFGILLLYRPLQSLLSPKLSNILMKWYFCSAVDMRQVVTLDSVDFSQRETDTLLNRCWPVFIMSIFGGILPPKRIFSSNDRLVQPEMFAVLCIVGWEDKCR